MATADEVNADMLAFWNGSGGEGWVARQAHTDLTLAEATEALVRFAAPRAGEQVADVGCGCGAPTLDFARAVGPGGRVVGIDISGPMLAEGERRSKAAGLTNVVWRQADPATERLDQYDLLVSAFGTMFFGDAVAAFKNMRLGAAPNARMALLCWRGLSENPWIAGDVCVCRSGICSRCARRSRLGGAAFRKARFGLGYRGRTRIGRSGRPINRNRRGQ